MEQNGSSNQSKASVVIVTYNRPGEVVKAVKSIRKFNDDIQIVVIDQESTAHLSDSDIESLKIEYYNLPKANISAARNSGIEKASGDIIIFIDDDLELAEGAIDAHVHAYTDGIAGTAGRVLVDGEEVPENTDVITGKTNSFGTNFIIKFWSTKKQYVDFPYGCNMSFRKSTLKEVGSFDPRFDRMFDEIDLGVRIKKAGKKILFVPEALGYHHKAKEGGARETVDTKINIFYDNYGYYIAKNVNPILSLLALGKRTVSAFKEKPAATFFFIKGFIQYYLKIK